MRICREVRRVEIKEKRNVEGEIQNSYSRVYILFRERARIRNYKALTGINFEESYKKLETTKL
jgi:hypothetical protein